MKSAFSEGTPLSDVRHIKLVCPWCEKSSTMELTLPRKKEKAKRQVLLDSYKIVAEPCAEAILNLVDKHPILTGRRFHLKEVVMALKTNPRFEMVSSRYVGEVIRQVLGIRTSQIGGKTVLTLTEKDVKALRARING